MINDDTLTLYFYKDGLTDDERKRIASALRSDTNLAARYDVLCRQMTAWRNSETPAAPSHLLERWHDSIDRAARMESAPTEIAKPRTFQFPSFAWGGALAATLALGVALGVFFSGNVIGGTAAGDGNVISANLQTGVLIDGGAGNTLQNNIIGLAADGITPRGNGTFALQPGVEIGNNNTGPNFIGTPGNGNLISGNAGDGILARFATIVEDNLIGLDSSGTAAVPNVQGGVVLDPGSDGAMVLGNVISGNGGGGVMIVMSDNHTVSGNLIGTDPTGTMAIGNLVGIDIIGDSNTISGNLISGHSTGEGIVILQGDFNDVLGNSIGTNISGTAPLANGGVGVSVLSGTGNTIGGSGGGDSVGSDVRD